MKSVYITLLVVLVALARAQDEDCPVRDVDAAKAEDSTRVCRSACTVTTDCTATNKQCLCDDLCGLSCYNPDAECPSLTGTLVNGVINTRKGITYGSTATYICNNGYYRTGVKERICRSTREWSHTPANCTKGCFNPTAQNNGFANVDLATGFAVGTVVPYECRSGYQLTVPGANMDVTCQSDFTWTPVQFECVRKNCGHPGTIDNGYLEGDNFDFGQFVTYKCDPGYELSGRATWSCSATAEWNPPDTDRPVCKPVTCEAPPVIENGVVDDSQAADREFEDLLYYSCNAGYKLVGPTQGECNATGKWGPVPTCEVDLDCDFETSTQPTCSFTVVSGSFGRQSETQSTGFPGFSLKGNGVLRSSIAYPLGADEEACIEVEFKTTQPDILKAMASDLSTTKLLWTAGQSPAWTTDKFKLTKVNPDDTEVYLQFEATADVVLDNIKQLNIAECASVTTPTASSTSTSTTATTEPPTIPNTASGITSTTSTTTTTTPPGSAGSSTTPTTTSTSTSSGATALSTTERTEPTDHTETSEPEGFPVYGIVVITVVVACGAVSATIYILYRNEIICYDKETVSPEKAYTAANVTDLNSPPLQPKVTDVSLELTPNTAPPGAHVF